MCEAWGSRSTSGSANVSEYENDNDKAGSDFVSFGSDGKVPRKKGLTRFC